MSSRLERLLSIESEIRRGRYPSVEHLCSLFEIQPRTVYEDIRELRERLGLPIAYDRFRNGYYNRNPEKSLPQFDLDEMEILGLSLGKSLLSQFTGATYEPVLRAALNKVIDRLPDRTKAKYENAHRKVIFKHVEVIPISRQIFCDFNRACAECLCIDITYFAAGTGITTKRQVNPYRLLQAGAKWYLVADCMARNDLRLFAMHRISDYKVQKAKFVPSRDSDIESWLKDTKLWCCSQGN